MQKISPNVMRVTLEWLYINLQFSRIFLLCKEATVGLLLTGQKANKEQYLFLKICCMKLGEHQMKIKTYRRNNKMCLQGCVHNILLVCFLSLQDSTCKTRKNVFLFHFKSSFRSQENQILKFQIFKFHDVTKCLSIK